MIEITNFNSKRKVILRSKKESIFINYNIMRY